MSWSFIEGLGVLSSLVHLGYGRKELGKKPSLSSLDIWALHGLGLRAPGLLGKIAGTATRGYLPHGPCGGLLCRGGALGCRGLGTTLSPQEPTI